MCEFGCWVGQQSEGPEEKSQRSSSQHAEGQVMRYGRRERVREERQKDGDPTIAHRGLLVLLSALAADIWAVSMKTPSYLSEEKGADGCLWLDLVNISVHMMSRRKTP